MLDLLLNEESKKNLLIFKKFSALSLKMLQEKGILRHLDVGHGKDLSFPIQIAHRFPELEIYYFDTSDWISRILSAGKRKKKLPDNLKLTSSPEGEFSSASYFLTIHDYQNPAEEFAKTAELIKPKGLLIVIDYQLKNATREEFLRVFGADNEKKALDKEGEDCFRLHSRYCLDDCIADARKAGFGLKLDSVSGREYFGRDKFFLYIGEKNK